MTAIAGRLTERVTLEAPLATPDGDGGETVEYVPLVPAEVFAAIESLAGTERIQLQANEVALAFRVRIRWHAGVGAATRIAWGTRTLEVVGPPVELERRAIQELYCVERGR